MKYFEFGQEHPELMVMLHGGGVCYRGALPVAQEMAKIYHVVLVAYDGLCPAGIVACNLLAVGEECHRAAGCAVLAELRSHAVSSGGFVIGVDGV